MKNKEKEDFAQQALDFLVEKGVSREDMNKVLSCAYRKAAAIKKI